MQRTLSWFLALAGLTALCGLGPLAADTLQARVSNEAPTVRIENAAVCQDVVDRMPVASGEVFDRQVPRLYCWSRVVGAVGDTFVTHNWYHKGILKTSVQLPVRSADWRTWSAKTMDPEWTGEWMVEILSAEGVPLESILFFVR